MVAKYWRLTIVYLLVGCATPYQDMGFGGGVESSVIDGRHARISARGNAFTDSGTLQEYVLLKAAEQTQALGMRYFIVVTAADTTKISQYTAPTQSYTTTTGSINVYSMGSSTYGNYYDTSNTTTYGGQTYNFVKPGSETMIRMFREEEVNANSGALFDAPAIVQNLGNKYTRTP